MKFVPLLSSLGIEFLPGTLSEEMEAAADRFASTEEAVMAHSLYFQMCRGRIGFDHSVPTAEAPDELARAFLEVVRKVKDEGACQLCEPRLSVLACCDRTVCIQVIAWIRACR